MKFLSEVLTEWIPKRPLNLIWIFSRMGNSVLNMISDGKDDRSFNVSQYPIDAKKKVRITMMPYGGFSGRVKII